MEKLTQLPTARHRAGCMICGAELEYGVSITDGCIGFEETENLLGELAEAVLRRRALGATPVQRAPDAEAV